MWFYYYCISLFYELFAIFLSYPGNYGRYLELKAERMAALDAETDRARTKLRKEAEWMSRQPK